MYGLVKLANENIPINIQEAIDDPQEQQRVNSSYQHAQNQIMEQQNRADDYALDGDRLEGIRNALTGAGAIGGGALLGARGRQLGKSVGKSVGMGAFGAGAGGLLGNVSGQVATKHPLQEARMGQNTAQGLSDEAVENMKNIEQQYGMQAPD